MTDTPVVSSPPGTEECHYLVFSPGTKPLGGETDTPITEAFANLMDGNESMVLIIRIADPKNAPPKGFWQRVRIIPAPHTPQGSGNGRFRCSGQAWLLDGNGFDTGAARLFSAEFRIADEAPGTILGELTV